MYLHIKRSEQLHIHTSKLNVLANILSHPIIQ